MRDFPGVEIVVSSDWRWRARFSDLVAMFSEDIGKRIVGVTPVSGSGYEGSRYREIIEYLEALTCRPENVDEVAPAPVWVAIDDTPELFPDAVIGRQVLLTDPAVGFDGRFAAQLRVVLAHVGRDRLRKRP